MVRYRIGKLEEGFTPTKRTEKLRLKGPRIKFQSHVFWHKELRVEDQKWAGKKKEKEQKVVTPRSEKSKLWRRKSVEKTPEEDKKTITDKKNTCKKTVKNRQGQVNHGSESKNKKNKQIWT